MSRPGWRQPARVGDAVAALFQRLGLDDRIRQHEVWRVWAAVVGPQIARQAQPHALWHGRLIVHVTDPIWLHHLSMMRHRLVTALNEKLHSSMVREMILKVGEVPPLPAAPPAATHGAPAPRPDPARLAQIEELLSPLGDAPFREELYQLLLRAAQPPERNPAR